MRTSYFTFGQSHRHEVDGVVYDKDCVVKITAENPRKVMHDTFGPKWAFEYSDIEKLNIESYYPRGVIEL